MLNHNIYFEEKWLEIISVNLGILFLTGALVQEFLSRMWKYR